MIDVIESISWGSLENLFFVVPMIIIFCTILTWQFRAITRVKALLFSRKNAAKNSFLTTSRLLLRVLLMMLGVICLGIALLRPQWNKRDEMVRQEGRDMLIAVDVSRSMLADDCKPSRLALTKQKVRDLVQQLSCERVGLLLFSGAAYIQCPLTSDYDAFFMFLDALDVETLSSGTTVLDEAIKKALTAFANAPSRKNKLLLLFTDGEDFSSNLSGVKRAAQQENMTIFAVGVGSLEGAPIPLFDEKGRPAGHQKDKKGSIVISRLNEKMLTELATESGGFYVRASCDDNRDIKQIVQKVSLVEKEALEDKKITEYEQQYHYFLLMSFICFALEWIL